MTASQAQLKDMQYSIAKAGSFQIATVWFHMGGEQNLALRQVPMREANGFTTKLVPMTMRRSAFGKSAFALVKNLAGRFSPATHNVLLKL